MPEKAAIGRANYEFFLTNVALLPYTPEQLLSISQQEWERAVSFEQIEKQRNQDLPELTIAASTEEQIRNSDRDELAIRNSSRTKESSRFPLKSATTRSSSRRHISMLLPISASATIFCIRPGVR